MEPNEAMQKLGEAYELLQGLSIKTTMGNLEILLQVLYNIRDVNAFIEKEAAFGGRLAAGTERRDDN